jgi:hypothetical protein
VLISLVCLVNVSKVPKLLGECRVGEVRVDVGDCRAVVAWEWNEARTEEAGREKFRRLRGGGGGAFVGGLAVELDFGLVDGRAGRGLFGGSDGGSLRSIVEDFADRFWRLCFLRIDCCCWRTCGGLGVVFGFDKAAACKEATEAECCRAAGGVGGGKSEKERRTEGAIIGREESREAPPILNNNSNQETVDSVTRDKTRRSNLISIP